MNSVRNHSSLQQRADYTYRFNSKTGRHGWLRLTPAYSVKIVEEIIEKHPEARRVLDPFCGTGTTALSAAYHGHEGGTTDINPFLVWLANAKISHFSLDNILRAQSASDVALDLVRRQAIEPASAPPIHNIERWWSPEALDFLRFLKAAILIATDDGSLQRTLLLVAFCRTLIKLSNAAFNHQSMSFKADNQLKFEFGIDTIGSFSDDVKFVLQGAAENPIGFGYALLGDSRNLAATVNGAFDLVVTSPPYANRMSYIRELRPYMYWLEFLTNGRDAGELDWTAVGGTWGVATSRLTEWYRPAEHFRSEQLSNVLAMIAHNDNKNGPLLANYVAKYFDDMWVHFQSLSLVLAPGAKIHYIVGNSTFYGILVPTELLFKEMLIALGFDSVECRPIRKRNSKRELIEFDVTANWLL